MKRPVLSGSRSWAAVLPVAGACLACDPAAGQIAKHDAASKTVSIIGSDDPSRPDVFIIDQVGSRLSITYGSSSTGSSTLVVPTSRVVKIVFDLMSGNDTLTSISTLTIPLKGTGGDGDDLIMTGNGPDLVEGGAGADLISTFGGADVVIGGDGDDVITSGDGADVVYGYVPLPPDWTQPSEFVQDADVIDAGRGEDYVEGGPADDEISGGDDRDIIHGFIPLIAGYTPPFEYHDADVINAGGGSDEVYGGPSNDRITGGPGNDVIEGYIAQSVSTRLLFCSDDDEISADAGNDVVGGGPGVDVIDAGVGDDVVRAGTGMDTVLGQNGADALYGGEDADLLYGGGGADLIWGEGGDDYIACGSAADYADGGDGNDEIWGNDEENSLSGGAGNDVINGGPANDSIEGGDGDDVIQGFAGNDFIDGGAGRDDLTGNAGDDYILAGVTDSDFDALQGSGGADTLFGSAGGDRLNGGDGDDLLVALDATTSNTLVGGAGEDSFWIDRRIESGVSTTDVHDASATELDSHVHAVDDLLGDADYTWDGDDLDDPAGGDFYMAYPAVPLFDPAGVSYADVRQNQLGDCWLLSALASMAYTEPKSIRQAILELPDHSYIVDYSSHHIRIDDQLPHTDDTYTELIFAGITSDDGDTSPQMWVAMLEKAVAMYRFHIGSIALWEDYDRLEGGVPGFVYADFRLERRSLFESVGDELLTWGARSLAEWVDGELAAGNCVTFCTKASGIDPRFVGNHCYAVLEVLRADAPGFDEDGEPYEAGDPIAVRVFNPWNSDGEVPADDNPDDGEVTATVKQLQNAAQLGSAMFGFNVGDPSAFR